MRGVIQLSLPIAFFVCAIIFGGTGYYIATKYRQPPTDTTAAVVMSATDEISLSAQPATSTHPDVLTQPATSTSPTDVTVLTPTKTAPTPKQTTQPKEKNISNTVADYYEANAILNGKSLEILNDYSSDIDRYIQGVPKLVSGFKTMVKIAFPSSDTSKIDRYLDAWGAGYIRDFTNLKSTVSSTYQKLQNQQNSLMTISRRLRSEYIPASDGELYASEIDIYSKQNNHWLDEIAKAHNSLTSRFIQDKDNTNETIYHAGTTNINSQSAALPTYQPLPTTAPTYNLPVRTFCDRVGSQSLCTTYGL